MVLLIGNYSLDQQQSMQRFNAMMLQGLRECGVEAELVRPPAVLGRIRALGGTAAKWLGYIDKFILFQWLASVHSKRHYLQQNEHLHLRATLAENTALQLRQNHYLRKIAP